MIIEMLLMGCFDFAPIHNPRKEIDAYEQHTEIRP